MKNFIIVIVLTLSLFSCKKQDVEKISAQELKDKYAIVLPDLKYVGDEEPVIPPGSNQKQKKNAATVTVTVSHDLSAEVISDTLTGEISPDAYVAGGQKFSDTTTVDGAIGLWACNRSYPAPPGIGTITNCPTEGTGYYRIFSADFNTYNVHLSWFIHKL